ncbi:little elongation complex subunit 2 isoform X2 [Osmerus mordax]|uniref:little elongation complex subunit 2 isoform X2 n=1 Tax=Osmerus mordax TaxID=8014 RepID=UPI00351065D3
MELIWEDIPPSDGPFFTRDLYDKYSLAPSIKELWVLSQSPTVNTEVKRVTKNITRKPDIPPPKEGEKSNNSNDGSACWESQDSEDDHKDIKTTMNKKSQGQATSAYPEPRVPFPCVSSLTCKEQMLYLQALTSKSCREPPQNLGRVNIEVSQFMNYLQDVARKCAEDYNYISQGAGLYTEEYFRACLERIQTYPQLYLIHEMTSLTGGTFSPDLCLTFEKLLVTMGNVVIADRNLLPDEPQLATDYESVSSEKSPVKKASVSLAAVSSDSNANKLCARYEPHVCLTRDALVRLLNNHGPDFSDPWELPLWVKTKPGKGSSQRKTAYIDSPLLKTEVTIRERSHIYHEESLMLSVRKDGCKNVSDIKTEIPPSKKLPPVKESLQRSLVSFESSCMDFDVDLTDLETFGESSKSSEKLTSLKQPSPAVKPEGSILPQPKAKSPESCILAEKGSSVQREGNSWSDTESSKEEPAEKEDSDCGPAPRSVIRQAKKLKIDSDESEEDALFDRDSEDERLVIVDLTSPDTSASKQTKRLAKTASKFLPRHADTPMSSSAESVHESPQSHRPSPALPPSEGPKRDRRRAKAPQDQLGQILRMQKAMLKPSQSQAQEPAKASARPPEALSPHRAVGPPGHGHPQSMVKPCVSSYLQSEDTLDRESSVAASTGPVTAGTLHGAQQKKLLSQDLLVSAEDEQDYEAPEEGNLLYKLYSLQDLLVMVRSSVALAQIKTMGVYGPKKFVPVHVLPKLEYQLCYGMECLTKSEICQLWAETLLHSSNVSYIGHIDALTSKVAQLKKLPVDWTQKASMDFKPSKSLNILHHLLKKITVLEEGRYMIGHKAGEPFVTIYKAAEGRKVSRGAYDLQQAHSRLPQPPTQGRVPWVPVDPANVQPFHKKHGRVPCTFPPRDFQKAVPNPNQGVKKKKNNNKGARAKRRDVWLQKKNQRDNNRDK